MANIAAALKDEISRVSRKEIRSETESLKKASSRYRSEIAELKRRLHAMEQLVGRLNKAKPKNAAPTSDDEDQTKLRFNAKGFGSLRQRLELSAAEVGLLVGTSGQSVYNWENGKTRPRSSHLPAIAALRRMGKREIAAKLEALRQANE